MTPRANLAGEGSFPVSSPIPSILPTKQYPHLLKLLGEIDYLCANCSSAAGQRVYRTLAESVDHLQPISGPMSRTKSGKLKPMTTRFGVLCPVCRTMPEDTDMLGFSKGIVDLLAFPADYKRPDRPTASTSVRGVQTEEDEELGEVTTHREQKAAKIVSAKRGPQKKKSDLKKSSGLELPAK